MYDNLDYALKRARSARTRLGSYVATLIVPDDGSVKVCQTGANRRHYTIYLKGAQALALVQGQTAPALDEEQANG